MQENAGQPTGTYNPSLTASLYGDSELDAGGEGLEEEVQGVGGWEGQAADVLRQTLLEGGAFRKPPPPSQAQLDAALKVVTDLGGQVHLVGLSGEQQAFVMDVVAAMIFADVITDPRDSWPVVIVVSGGPGTGKTHTLTALVKMLNHLSLSFLVGATTHAAAHRLGVEGATTVDAHLQLVPHRKLDFLPAHHPTNVVLCKSHGQCIDEFSMLSSPKAQVVGFRIKTATKLGSLRKVLVLSGDKHQLPSPCRHTLLQGICPNCHLQGSTLWQTAIHHRLTFSYRHQDDPEFGTFLTEIEDKAPTQARIDQVLGDRLREDEPEAVANLWNPGAKVLCSHIVDVLSLNSEIIRLEASKEVGGQPLPVTRLRKTGVLIKKHRSDKPVNPRRFQYIEQRCHKDWGSDQWNEHTLREVGVGAPVFFTAVVDKRKGAVTCAEGIIKDYLMDDGVVTRVTVEVVDTKKQVHVTRTNYKPRTVGDEDFARYEFPLILAYAMTAHRCQGATMRLRVIIKCRSAFAAGMLYVMLSGVPSRQDLFIIGSLAPSDFLPAQLSMEAITRMGLLQAAKARRKVRK